MKVYKIGSSIVIEHNNEYFKIVEENWDKFVNDDNLYDKLEIMVESGTPEPLGKTLVADVEAPIQSQEIWASGVTYLKSKTGRQEESSKKSAADFYADVYEADRPELFFKAMKNRVVGHNGMVRIRKDSTWNVPEPELTLFISSNAKIIGYTIGNDMSSRSIEGENPLYLPQAKTYDGCAALGPCIYVPKEPLPSDTEIKLNISRESEIVFNGDIKIDQIKRNFEELVEYLYRECTFINGCFLMTGTGIVPIREFTLQIGDKIDIDITSIGTLSNTVGE